ncbi:hypothetical protein NKH18_37950 [Streptomyces sp. M10(2022)]
MVAERIRRSTDAEYVVIMDRHGVRWSHTDAPGSARSYPPTPARRSRVHP